MQTYSQWSAWHPLFLFIIKKLYGGKRISRFTWSWIVVAILNSLGTMQSSHYQFRNLATELFLLSSVLFLKKEKNVVTAALTLFRRPSFFLQNTMRLSEGKFRKSAEIHIG